MKRLDVDDADNDGDTSEWMVYYYHTDAQGNVAALTIGENTNFSNGAGGNLASGTVVEKYTYDVYGVVTIKDRNGVVLSQSKTRNPYLFQGRRLDEESGLYYFRNRQYDPVHGRFLSRDPMGYLDSLNLYQFVNNNPMCYRDPTGEWALLLGLAIILAPKHLMMYEMEAIGEGAGWVADALLGPGYGDYPRAACYLSASIVHDPMNNIIGHAKGILATGKLPRYDNGVFIYEDAGSGLSAGAAAQTYGIVILANDPHINVLDEVHEREHVRQYKRWGIFNTIKMVDNWLAVVLADRYENPHFRGMFPRDPNIHAPHEIQAYKRGNEYAMRWGTVRSPDPDAQKYLSNRMWNEWSHWDPQWPWEDLKP